MSEKEYDLIEDKVIPEKVLLPRVSYKLDKGFSEGDTVKLDGIINDTTEPILQYTFSRPPAEGKKYVIEFEMAVIEVKNKLTEIE